MSSNKKIQAFTLPEILVVLVISAIVVGLAFSVLDLVQNNLRAIKENYAATTEVQHFKQQLAIDFNRFHDISYSGPLEELRLKTPLDSIRYTFTGDVFVRNFDTIPVRVDRVEFFFLGNATSGGRVDALKIFLARPSEEFIFISRMNDAKAYFD